MKPGLVSITLRALPPEQIIRLVAQAGLEGIEWGGDVHVPHGDLERAREVGRMTREAGLSVAAYGSYYNFSDCDAPASKVGPSMEAVVDTADALGAPAVRVWAGSRSPAETPADLRKRIVNRAHAMGELARKRRMRVDFEFHENTLTETAADTVQLLHEVAHPSVRTLWQPPLQTAPMHRLKGLEQVRQWATNVHCNYFDQDPWPHIHALCEGTEEWSGYLAALQEDATERWILLEHVRNHSIEAFGEDAATLRGWLDAV